VDTAVIARIPKVESDQPVLLVAYSAGDLRECSRIICISGSRWVASCIVSSSRTTAEDVQHSLT
jgi:hypothetical protein